MSRDEWLAFPPANRQLLHPYSDAARLAEPTIACYVPAEMLAEKLRAISGQRRFAISRDLYDLYRLAATGIDIGAVRAVLPAKFAAKGLPAAAISVEQLAAQRELFQRDWDRRLAHLFPDGQLTPFDRVWETVRALVEALESQNLSD